MKRKIIIMLMTVFSLLLCTKGVYAASASISASKTSVTVGTKVTITVKVNAAAWNLKVSGDVSGSIVGFNADAENQSTTKTYSITPSKAGTYKVSLTGDITDENSDTATDINKSVTITVKEKTTTNTTGTTNNNTTTAKKSSDANISKLTLSVEGLSFKSSQTTYNINVGDNINDITVGVKLSSSKASYKVTGNKNLKAGNNVIKIVVTAEDGTKKTYKINVNKEGNAEDSSAELSNLIIEDMIFTTQFLSTETEYLGSQIKYTKSLNVLPYPVSEKASYEIIGNDNLKVGENTIVVKVTSYDETNVVEYKVTFNMLSYEESNALQTVNPYMDVFPVIEQTGDIDVIKEIILQNSTVILLYVLALVEFGQVIYLYIQLKNVNPSAVAIKRRRKNRIKEKN